MVAASHASPQREAPPSCISSVWGSGHIHASERASSPHTPLEKWDLHARITSERGGLILQTHHFNEKGFFSPSHISSESGSSCHLSQKRMGPCPPVSPHRGVPGPQESPQRGGGCTLTQHLRGRSSSLRMISERVFHPHKSPQTSSHLTHLLRHRVLAVTRHLREGGLVLMHHHDSFLSITSGRRSHVHQHHSESGFLALTHHLREGGLTLTRHLREGGLLFEHQLRESGASASHISSEMGPRSRASPRRGGLHSHTNATLFGKGSLQK